MPQHVDEMRKRYEEFSQGDLESALQNWADDVVWQGSNSTELPGGGETSGKEDIGGLLQSVGSDWDEFNLTPDEFFESPPDRVAAIGFYRGRVEDTGREFEASFCHVFRCNEERIAELRQITDTVRWMEALEPA